MERLCFFIHLKTGQEKEYERRHDEIWPDMAQAVSAAGYTNYTLFRKDLLVVGYAECVPDVATVFALMGEAEVGARWTESFADIIDTMTGPDGAVLQADEVWHLR